MILFFVILRVLNVNANEKEKRKKENKQRQTLITKTFMIFSYRLH